MNRQSTNLTTIVLHMAFLVLMGLVLSATPVLGQDNDDSGAERYSRGELAQMLAPVALYPDVVLTHVLMAATYPIEVVEAQRWLETNRELTAENLDNRLLEKEWAPSVKALCHYPYILELMSERISDTAKIGDAFLAQEAEVMDMIQELRRRANWHGTLVSSAEQKVVVEKETIVIEPTNPQVVYVPYYDPYWAYGYWWYPAYRPYIWGPPGVYIGVGFSYWPAYYFSFAYGPWCYFHWPSRCIYVDGHRRPRYVKHDHWDKGSARWHHSPKHRKGMSYGRGHVGRGDDRNARHSGDGYGKNRDAGGRNYHQGGNRPDSRESIGRREASSRGTAVGRSRGQSSDYKSGGANYSVSTPRGRVRSTYDSDATSRGDRPRSPDVRSRVGATNGSGVSSTERRGHAVESQGTANVQRQVAPRGHAVYRERPQTSSGGAYRGAQTSSEGGAYRGAQRGGGSAPSYGGARSARPSYSYPESYGSGGGGGERFTRGSRGHGGRR